jgi:hypothetical protein
MFIQDATPDTSAYMIAGYAIFFVFMIIYLVSLFLRSRNLNQDLTVLESMKKPGQAAEGKLKAGSPEPAPPMKIKPPPARRKTAKTKARTPNKVKKKVTKKK